MQPATAVRFLAIPLRMAAMIAVQGASGSVAQSLNPLTCLRLIQRLGTDYLLILSSIVLLGIAGTAIVSASGGALPPIVRIALLMYGWLAIFAASTRMIPDEPPPTR